MSAPNGPDILNSAPRAQPTEVVATQPAQAEPQPEAPPVLCGECGLLYASDQMLDFCDNCGAPRCRTCAARVNDDNGGVYICSTCADALDALGPADALDSF
jgi:hypothetical protein